MLHATVIPVQCYRCTGPVRAPRTTPGARWAAPSSLYGLHGDALHRAPRLPPLITLATLVTAHARESRATVAAALNVAALRDGAQVGAAAGRAHVTLGIPPVIRLDQSQ